MNKERLEGELTKMVVRKLDAMQFRGFQRCKPHGPPSGNFSTKSPSTIFFTSFTTLTIHTPNASNSRSAPSSTHPPPNLYPHQDGKPQCPHHQHAPPRSPQAPRKDTKLTISLTVCHQVNQVHRPSPRPHPSPAPQARGQDRDRHLPPRDRREGAQRGKGPCSRARCFRQGRQEGRTECAAR
jgi:hypothetical protein